MPEKKNKTVLGAFIQLGDPKDVDPEEIDAKIRLFSELAGALDGGQPRIETAIAFGAMKTMCEQRLGFNVDVGVRSTEGKDPAVVAQEIKDEYERSGRIEERAPAAANPFKRPGSADPTFH
jgi:hypothetical protein